MLLFMEIHFSYCRPRGEFRLVLAGIELQAHILGNPEIIMERDAFFQLLIFRFGRIDRGGGGKSEL